MTAKDIMKQAEALAMKLVGVLKVDDFDEFTEALKRVYITECKKQPAKVRPDFEEAFYALDMQELFSCRPD